MAWAAQRLGDRLHHDDGPADAEGHGQPQREQHAGLGPADQIVDPGAVGGQLRIDGRHLVVQGQLGFLEGRLGDFGQARVHVHGGRRTAGAQIGQQPFSLGGVDLQRLADRGHQLALAVGCLHGAHRVELGHGRVARAGPRLGVIRHRGGVAEGEQLVLLETAQVQHLPAHRAGAFHQLELVAGHLPLGVRGEAQSEVAAHGDGGQGRQHRGRRPDQAGPHAESAQQVDERVHGISRG
jgi:hypothetical protein